MNLIEKNIENKIVVELNESQLLSIDGGKLSPGGAFMGPVAVAWAFIELYQWGYDYAAARLPQK